MHKPDDLSKSLIAFEQDASHQTNPNLTVPISALKEALWSHARKSTVMMAGSV